MDVMSSRLKFWVSDPVLGAAGHSSKSPCLHSLEMGEVFIIRMNQGLMFILAPGMNGWIEGRKSVLLENKTRWCISFGAQD